MTWWLILWTSGVFAGQIELGSRAECESLRAQYARAYDGRCQREKPRWSTTATHESQHSRGLGR